MTYTKKPFSDASVYIFNMKPLPVEMALWLDTKCQHPYIFVSIDKYNDETFYLTIRPAGSPAPSVYWTSAIDASGKRKTPFTLMAPRYVDLRFNQPTGTTEEVLVERFAADRSKFYVVFDDLADLEEFKRLFG